jgi:putative FmdB family regulatory protein
MPIYEYECQGCGNRFEKILYGSAAPSCPSCGSAAVDKLISTFAVASANAGVRASEAPAACGTCGDPRGPGACSLDN